MPTPAALGPTVRSSSSFAVSSTDTASNDLQSAAPDVTTPGDPAAVFDRRPGSQAILSGGAGVGANAVNLRAAAISDLPAGYSLPDKVPLAAKTIHRYDDPRVTPSTIAVSVWAPLPPPGAAAVAEDLNAAGYADRLPDRFVLTDAGMTRCFVGVDKRPGTPLAAKLDELIERMPKNAAGDVDTEQALEWVRSQVNSIIRWTPGSSANDGRAEFEWDKAISVPDSVWDTFSSVAFADVTAPATPAGVDYPVVPFENYLDAGEGYCLQKAVLAALLLDRLEIPSKLVNGAVAMGPGKTCGHSWVELDDGRVLDAAWSSLQAKGPAPDDFPDRYQFGGRARFGNQTFPYLRYL